MYLTRKTSGTVALGSDVDSVPHMPRYELHGLGQRCTYILMSYTVHTARYICRCRRHNLKHTRTRCVKFVAAVQPAGSGQGSSVAGRKVSSMSILSIVCTLTPLCATTIITSHNQHCNVSFHQAPGPPTLPVLGTTPTVLHRLLVKGENLEDVLLDWVKQYGSFVEWKLPGASALVVVADADAIREVSVQVHGTVASTAARMSLKAVDISHV